MQYPSWNQYTDRPFKLAQKTLIHLASGRVLTNFIIFVTPSTFSNFINRIFLNTTTTYTYTLSITIMTVDTLSNEFNITLNLDESNRMNPNKTPAKSLATSAAVVSPEPADSPSVSSGSSVDSLDDTHVVNSKQVQVSKHKLDELAGRHLEEPLLKENPGRFVLFPIQDNEVST